MYVIGHDDDDLQVEPLSVVVDAVRENKIACRAGEGNANQLAESHKERTARLLVMRHAPAVFVFVSKDARTSHGLLQAARSAPSVIGEHIRTDTFSADFGSALGMSRSKSKSTARSTAADRSVRPTLIPDLGICLSIWRNYTIGLKSMNARQI